jgi:hypothetical protein
MKETAVEFLFKEFCETPKDKFTWYYLFEKAKEMEKEQIIDAFKAGAFYPGHELEAEQYYWENYGDK